MSAPPEGPLYATVDHYKMQARADPDVSPSELFERVRERMFDYDIFPPGLIRAVICPSGSVARGATIIQHMVLGPVALEMAVRVIDVWDRDDGGVREAGFTYATVAGHPECGIATLRVRIQQVGPVLVLVEARSRPGLLLTRLARPLAREVQRGLTRAALRRLAKG